MVRLPELVDRLPALVAEAGRLGGEPDGLDWIGPGGRFDGSVPGPFTPGGPLRDEPVR